MYLLDTISLRSRLPSRAFLSVVSILALLAFSACSSAPPVEVRTVPVEVARPESRPPLPNPQPIETQPFKWKVIVLRPDGTVEHGPVLDQKQPFYAITPADYEILARNMAEMLRWVKEAYWRLNYYRGDGELDGNTIPAQ